MCRSQAVAASLHHLLCSMLLLAAAASATVQPRPAADLPPHLPASADAALPENAALAAAALLAAPLAAAELLAASEARALLLAAAPLAAAELFAALHLAEMLQILQLVLAAPSAHRETMLLAAAPATPAAKGQSMGNQYAINMQHVICIM